MQELLVRSVIGFLLAPFLVHHAFRTIIVYSLTRGPRIWWAAGAAIYGVVAFVLGLAQGGLAGGSLATLLSQTGTAAWLLSVFGAGLSVALTFFIIIRVYAKYRDALAEAQSRAM